MMDAKKYMTTVGILIAVLIVGGLGINIFVSNLTHVFSVLINIIVVVLVCIIIFSLIITNNVIKDKRVSPHFMKINFNIVSLLFPVITLIGNSIGVSKNELRKVFVKLNNNYIYSNKYNLKSEEILILIPHCIQKSSCKLKVTTKIENCAECGLCNVGDLVKLKEKTNVNIFVATGGTLARKIIIENKPKAVIAVACERDLTSGVQDVKGIPVLGVFNKRPNGPCVDTTIDINEVEKAINFFINKN
ncbi:DUF116 domain-containing protein [[Clostridium] dakarense]|uniref:DUF116 domain-containing protein n=1 Tax=Faecalimicrobium dakarense TaxID=1301100 RepID=UPI0006944336|nr:DUF116 domain-containing protein [[Clostridium] dakarense]